MMSDTAQLETAADPNAQILAGADAFKSFLNPAPERPRDDAGRFAPTQEEADEIEAAAAPAADVESDADDVDDLEAADEAQPEAVPMPASWSKDDEAVWTALPPEAQAKLVEREGQREAAVNQKFQEAANVRKANEALITEANANRDRFAQAADYVLSLVEPVRPDPRQYGLGTGNYDREGYDLAVLQYEQSQGQIDQIRQQRDQVAAQRAQEEDRALVEARQEIERSAWPAFVKDVPEMADPAKAPGLFNEIVAYAVAQGVPSAVFHDQETAKSLTSVEIHMAWKAMQYDRQREAASKVRQGNPPPKPAQPTVKPGGIASRSAVNASRLHKAQERLARTGSVEDGAAVFRHLFKG